MIRGEVYEVRLSPTEGSEQQGVNRPCVVVQRTVPAQYEAQNPVTIIVPLTDNNGKGQTKLNPFVPKGIGGTTKDSRVLCPQVRVVAKSRLGPKLGDMPPTIMALIDEGLRAILNL